MKQSIIAAFLLYFGAFAFNKAHAEGPNFTQQTPQNSQESINSYNDLRNIPVSSIGRDGTQGYAPVSQGPNKPAVWVATSAFSSSSVLRSYLAGLQMTTTAVSSVTVSAGIATNSTNTTAMTLSSSLNKSLASTWVVGDAQGGLDTGVVAISTWYHVWLIERPDTSNVDVLLSTSATGPLLPTNYTLQRRIGSVKTDASSHILQFVQDGDWFDWAAPVTDLSKTNPGTAAVTQALASVPTGVNVKARLIAMLRNTGTAGLNNYELYLSDLGTTDTAPSTTFANLIMTQAVSATAINTAGDFLVRTNTSAQIRYREGGLSDASTILTIITRGWIDTRGRDN